MSCLVCGEQIEALAGVHGRVHARGVGAVRCWHNTVTACCSTLDFGQDPTLALLPSWIVSRGIFGLLDLTWPQEPTILASALQASGARWSAQHAEATALRHRLEVSARNLDSGEGEEVDKDWVHRFVTSHQRLVELGCRLEAGFVDIDAELRRLQAVLGHARVLGALAASGQNDPGSRAALPSGAAVFHFGQTPEEGQYFWPQVSCCRWPDN
ncbi:ERD2 [Symbiodinium sp. CCMP2456]|nr:ERD2 [Symbiodinium sp. CCMP2456]